MSGLWNPTGKGGAVTVGPRNATRPTIIFTGIGLVVRVETGNGTRLWETRAGPGRDGMCALYNPWDDTVLAAGSFLGRDIQFGAVANLSSTNALLAPLPPTYSYTDAFVTALRPSDGAILSVLPFGGLGFDAAHSLALQPPAMLGARPLLWVAGTYGGWPVDLGGAGVLQASPGGGDGQSSFLVSMLPPSATADGVLLSAAAARAINNTACTITNAPPVGSDARRQAGIDGTGQVYLSDSGWQGPFTFGQLGTYVAPSPPVIFGSDPFLWSYVARLGNASSTIAPASAATFSVSSMDNMQQTEE